MQPAQRKNFETFIQQVWLYVHEYTAVHFGLLNYSFILRTSCFVGVSVKMHGVISFYYIPINHTSIELSVF